MKQPAAHDLSILGERERALAEQQVEPGERVRFCLVGHKGQVLIALDGRVVIVDAAGGQAASFAFAEIGAIEVSTGRRRSSIEIHTTVLGAISADDFWATDDATDRFKLPNSIRIANSDLETHAPYLAELRSLIGDAMQQSALIADAHEEMWAALAVQLQELRDVDRDALLADASSIDAALEALSA